MTFPEAKSLLQAAGIRGSVLMDLARYASDRELSAQREAYGVQAYRYATGPGKLELPAAIVAACEARLAKAPPHRDGWMTR